MYVNYLQDRKILGYEALNNTKCGTELMEIIDSTVLFVKKVSLNGKRNFIIISSEPEFADAIGMNSLPLPQ